MTGAELVTTESGALLRPVASIEDLRANAVLKQQVLDSALDPSDWQGRAGKEGSFLKRSGCNRIASFFGISTESIRENVTYNDACPVSASATFRAIAPNGQHADATAHCSIDEPRFEKAKGRQKLLNDLSSTAATRAANRAILNLSGFGKVSAEEVDAGERPPAAAARIPLADDALRIEAAQAVESFVLGSDGYDFLRILGRRYGNEAEVPEIAAQTLVGLLWFSSRNPIVASGDGPEPGDVVDESPADPLDDTESAVDGEPVDAETAR